MAGSNRAGALERPPRPRAASPVAKVLVLRSGALGDLVLTLPVLEALRVSVPHAEILYAGRSEFGRLIRRGGLADEVISSDRPEIVSLFSDSVHAPDGLRKAASPIALAVSFVKAPQVERNLLAAGAGELLSISPRPVPEKPASGGQDAPERAGIRTHAADHLLSVLRGRAGVSARAVPRLPVPDDLRERARGVLRGKGLEGGGFLALHPGSGSRSGESGKNWPAERFAELARRARDELDLKVAVLLGPAEAGHLTSALGPVADAILETPSLACLSGILAESAAYVGNDSGVTHLAASCGAPTVAVFGPTDPAVWAPRGGKVRVIRDPSGDLRRVEVDRVLEGLRSVLVSRPQEPASRR